MTDVGESAEAAGWREVEELFHRLVDEPPDRRAALLEASTADEAVRRDVVELLDAEDRLAGSPIEAAGLEAAELDLSPLGDEVLPRDLGRYRLLRLLGEGGMGTVYLAERSDGSIDRPVAVKLLANPFAGEPARARFELERETLARLDHPAIAKLYDADTAPDGSPYLVMEFVEGRALVEACEERGADLRERVEILARLAEALAHAHDRLVVHRDLKPQNVLLDERGEPHVLDFGIAKLVARDDDLELTRPGDRLLTPAYASPEQVAGAHVGPAADVYALGVIAHELLVGERPFSGSTTRTQLERAILDQVPAKLSAVARRGARSVCGLEPKTLARKLAGDLETIVAVCLRKEPERRYRSAAELAGDLHRFLDGRPVTARGDSALYRLGKLVRRRPVETAAAVLVGAGAIGGGTQLAAVTLANARQADQLFVLRTTRELRELRAEVDELWPMVPDRVDDLRAWLARFEELQGRRPELQRQFDDLERRIELDGASALGEMDRFRHEWIGEVFEGFDGLGDEDLHAATVAAVEHRLERATSLAERTALDASWAEAIEAVSRSPHYGGLELAPQLGLLPLGPDPASGLHEFVHVDSGDVPVRDADGRLSTSEEHGIVLVLIPGGTRTIGGQSDDPNAPHHDPRAAPDEGPPHRVSLDPYFIGKFEVTQAQWRRLTGANPSRYQPPVEVAKRSFTGLHPVEQVSTEEAVAWLARYDLALPTEARWEVAARAGTDAPYVLGTDVEALAGFANLADGYAQTHDGHADWPYVPEIDDGHTVHGPIGCFVPNPFGLHDILGNVWEWTLGEYLDYATHPARPGDGLRGAVDAAITVARGGAFRNSVEGLRVSERYKVGANLISYLAGFRVARDVRPAERSGIGATD